MDAQAGPFAALMAQATAQAQAQARAQGQAHAPMAQALAVPLRGDNAAARLMSDSDPARELARRGHRRSASTPAEELAGEYFSLERDASVGGMGGGDGAGGAAGGEVDETERLDPKRAKRILANRLSAARSKERKQRQSQELEQRAATLEAELAAAGAAAVALEHTVQLLERERVDLETHIDALERHKAVRDATRAVLQQAAMQHEAAQANAHRQQQQQQQQQPQHEQPEPQSPPQQQRPQEPEAQQPVAMQTSEPSQQHAAGPSRDDAAYGAAAGQLRETCAAVMTRNGALRPHAPRRGKSVVMPFTYTAAVQGALVRAMVSVVLLRPAALTCASVLASIMAARSRAAAEVWRRSASQWNRSASRWPLLRGLRSFGAAALLALLFSSRARAYLRFMMHAKTRAVWRCRLLAHARLDGAVTQAEWEAAHNDLVALSPQPRARAARAEPACRMSEFAMGVELLDELCAGRLRPLPSTGFGDDACDASDVHNMYVALRAGLAAHAGNVAALALDEQGAGYDASARQASADVLDVCQKLLYHTPDVPGFGAKERASLLEGALTICGRHALLLSGGGILGAVHVGVVHALQRAGCLPHVLAGSSAGSIVAAVVCTRNAVEIEEFLATWPKGGEPATELFTHFFGTVSVRQRIHNLFRSGALYPSVDLRMNLRRLLGDVTFRQAYDHSQRVLNVSVSAARWGEQPRLLNYLTAPNAVVWSAVAASCAFPGLYEPQELLAIDRHGRFVRFHTPAVAVEPHVSTDATGEPRRWRDGSVEADLPEAGLAELFHVSWSVVSQTNPWLVVALKVLNAMPRPLSVLFGGEMRHWCRQGKLLTTAAANAHKRTSRGVQLLFDLLSTFGQDWEGDVTVHNRAFSVQQVLASISNPSPADLAVLQLAGQRATWAQLPLLRRALEPINAMEAAASELRRQAKAAQRVPARRLSGGTPRVAATPRRASAFELCHSDSVPTFDKMVSVDVDASAAERTCAEWAGEAEPGVLLTPRPDRRHAAARRTYVREE